MEMGAIGTAARHAVLPPGTRVLVVEDHPVVALAAEDMIVLAGGASAGSAATLDAALAAAAGDHFDVVLLDLDLAGRSALPVATLLAARGVAFVVATGFDERMLAAFPDVPRLSKPYRAERLGAALSAALAGTSSSTSSVDSQRG